MIKRILCFGDSNTWGFIPAGGLQRYPENVRWTGLLQDKLADRAKVIDFGLCGCESGGWSMHKPFNTDAQSLFPSVLLASMPVDIVFIMLGTNDIKSRNEWKSGDTARNLQKLIYAVRQMSPSADIILAAPAYLDERIVSDPDYSMQAVSDSHLCAEEIRTLAETEHLHFFDSNDYVHELGADGCHWTAESHAAFAEKLAAFLCDSGLV
jgi:lysophospholipase L1-like esterase